MFEPPMPRAGDVDGFAYIVNEGIKFPPSSFKQHSARKILLDICNTSKEIRAKTNFTQPPESSRPCEVSSEDKILCQKNWHIMSFQENTVPNNTQAPKCKSFMAQGMMTGQMKEVKRR